VPTEENVLEFFDVDNLGSSDRDHPGGSGMSDKVGNHRRQRLAVEAKNI
jgi:hypothetical protein